jgi:hypothetical protein
VALKGGGEIEIGIFLVVVIAIVAEGIERGVRERKGKSGEEEMRPNFVFHEITGKNSLLKKIKNRERDFVGYNEEAIV